MLHLGSSSNNIWHSWFDPSFQPAVYEVVAEPPIFTGDGMTGVGVRRWVGGQDPEEAQVTVFLKQHKQWWWDTTLAKDSETGVNVEVGATHTCRDPVLRASLYTEVKVTGGPHAKSASRSGCL
jgi:hypothetical protein